MRLDVYLTKEHIFSSRERAKMAIEGGKVFVDGKKAKASMDVSGQENITVKDALEYVSRAALKLEKAVYAFNLNFDGKTVLDIGSSTGGFTEVALKFGAKKVIAVDVGKDQMVEKLRNDSRVSLFEGQDFRTIENSKIKDADFFVSDVSFISLKRIFPKLIEVFGNGLECVVLFKPQFECGKEIAKKFSGVIKEKSVHIALLQDFVSYLNENGLTLAKLDFSGIRGKEGNIEYLLKIGGEREAFSIREVVDKAFEELK